MGTELNKPVLAHVLFMDIVGFSKLPSDEQKTLVHRLQDLVRSSKEFKQARADDQVISLPTGDGMALAFFNKLDAAIVCAIEISKSIQAESLCGIRMGVHTGPVFVMEDINQKRNLSGAGINRAERVMSCGEAGHILVSDQAAESLRHLSAWVGKIHEFGECQVKDGWLRVWNLVDGPIGNPALPKKSKRYLLRRRRFVFAAEALLVFAVAAALVFAFRMGRAKNSVPAEDVASIAVLPFSDLSPEKNQEYLSDGLAEELLTGLASTPGLRVAGRTSSFQFKGKTLDCRTIGEKLNVATLLEGSVRKQGSRGRIAVQLIKTSDGFELWSEMYDREMNDIFALEEEIAHAVTGALKVRLLGGRTMPGLRSTNVEAYNAYLQGRFFYGRHNKEALEKANSYFEQSAKLDPRYAPAWAGLAESESLQAGAAYVPVEEGYRRARTAAEQALSLDPNFGEAHAAMGLIQMFHDWDWAGADRSYRRALELAAGNASVIRGAGSLARYLGHLDEAIGRYRQATQIDPLSSDAFGSFGVALHYAGREQEAIAAFHDALGLAPEMAIAHAMLAQVYLSQSQPQEALAETEKEKDPAYRLCGLALSYHALQRTKESDAAMAELTEKFQADSPYQIAEVFAFRGETNHALDWLEKAYKLRDPGMTDVKVDPLLKSLKGHPRYAALLERMHLPQ